MRAIMRDVVGGAPRQSGRLGDLAKVDLLQCPHALQKRGLFDIVEINMKETQLRVDDLCRVKQSQGRLGPTLYVVVFIGECCRCDIREAGNPRAAVQRSDTSLLRKVERC